MEKIKRVSAYKEYIEATEKLYSNGIYSRYSAIYDEVKNNTLDFIGVDWEIKDLITLSNPELEKICQKPILEDAKELLNVYCKDKHGIQEGVLIGLCITEEDCYWMLRDAGKIHYMSCVGGIERKYPEYES